MAQVHCDATLGDKLLLHPRFPSKEQGKLRKLSRPWHGAYIIIARKDPDISVVEVYFPEQNAVQVHQQRVVSARGARNGVEISYTLVRNLSEIWKSFRNLKCVHTCVSIEAMNFLQKRLSKLWAKV